MSRAFSLLELLVAASVTAVLVLILVSMADFVSRTWQRGESQIMASTNGRGALDLIGRELENAVIDLDIGFRMEAVDGEPNNFVLKFLRRKTPEEGGRAVEKVAYQMAWAGMGVLPRVQPDFDANHPISVLIRTSNERNLDDVFTVGAAMDVDQWSRDWGVLRASIQTGVEQADGDIVEIVSDNAIGWWVYPLYWDGQGIARDHAAQARFYGKNLTSDVAPEGLCIEIATVSPRAAGRLSSMPEWRRIRSDATLEEEVKNFPDGSFYQQLRESMRRFVAVPYLYSRTP